SASTPPHGPRTNTGPNDNAAFTPSAVPLPVSVRTSHDDAVKFIHVPTAETNCPDRYRRKFLELRSDENVLATEASRRDLIDRPPRGARGSRPRHRARHDPPGRDPGPASRGTRRCVGGRGGGASDPPA